MPVFCSVYLVYSFTVSLVRNARYCFDILRNGTIKNLMVFSKTALVGRDEQLGRVCVLRSLQEVRSLDPEECNDSSIAFITGLVVCVVSASSSLSRCSFWT